MKLCLFDLILLRMSCLYHGARQRYFYHFRNAEFNRRVSLRLGGCPDPRKCNCCIDVNRFFKCKYASVVNGCLLQNSPAKPELCVKTPFDEKDFNLWRRINDCDKYWAWAPQGEELKGWKAIK